MARFGPDRPSDAGGSGHRLIGEQATRPRENGDARNDFAYKLREQHDALQAHRDAIDERILDLPLP